MRFRFLALVAGLVVVGGLAAPACAQFDKVFDSTGRPIPGNVTEITSAEVALEANGATRKFPANEVKRVIFNEEPEELNEARESIAAGNFETAIQDLNKIDATKVTRAFIKQDLGYYRAYAAAQMALRGAADKEKAYLFMAAFVKEGGGMTSYHFYDAAEVMGDLAASQGDFARAANAYGVLSKAPFPEIVMHGATLEAQALLLQDKFPEALAKYEAVIANSAGGDSLKPRQIALLGKATCLAGAGKAAEAMTYVDEVLKKADPAKDGAILGRAYNAQGACFAKQNKPKDAILAYLRTDVLYYGDPDAHAEALYNLAKLWTTINKSDRSLQATNSLRQRYGGSPWASKK